MQGTSLGFKLLHETKDAAAAYFVSGRSPRKWGKRTSSLHNGSVGVIVWGAAVLGIARGAGKPPAAGRPKRRSALGANRTRRDSGNDVMDPKRSSGAFTRLAYRPLVTDRAMAAWYHPSIA
jgi:hypothetical protein